MSKKSWREKARGCFVVWNDLSNPTVTIHRTYISLVSLSNFELWNRLVLFKPGVGASISRFAYQSVCQSVCWFVFLSVRGKFSGSLKMAE